MPATKGSSQLELHVTVIVGMQKKPFSPLRLTLQQQLVWLNCKSQKTESRNTVSPKTPWRGGSISINATSSKDIKEARIG